MKPSAFDEQNTVFSSNPDPKHGWDELPALLVPRQLVLSVWEPTDEERAAIADGANVELIVQAGGNQPPVALNVYRISGFIRNQVELCATEGHLEGDTRFCIRCGAYLDA